MVNPPEKPGSRLPVDGGQATVEMALVLPVMFLVVAAVCQVALGLNCYLVVTAASREGARSGAESNDATAARKAASAAAAGLPGGAPGIQVEFPEGRERGRPVRVTVSYKMPLLLPGIGRMVPGVTFKRSTCMALERGRP